MQNIETINQLFNFSTSNMSEREAVMCTIAPNRLMDLYDRKKYTFCGMGIQACKHLLNCLIKRGNTKAALYKALLDAECSYVYMFKYIACARSFATHYAENFYLKVQNLLDVCLSCQIERGYTDSESFGMDSIVFMDIPEVGQVSYHTCLTSVTKKQMNIYNTEWDGNTDGIFIKLENAIMQTFSEEVKAKRIMRAKMWVGKLSGIPNVCGLLSSTDGLNEVGTIMVLADGKQISIRDLHLRITEDTSLVATPVTVRRERSYDGLIVINVKAQNDWNEKKCNSIILAAHRKMSQNESYIMTTTASDGRSFNIIAYVQPLFYTKREFYSNAAFIYSQVIIALSDYLNVAPQTVIANYLDNMDAIHENYITCAYGPTLFNNGFHLRTRRKDFKSDTDYSAYIIQHNFILPALWNAWDTILNRCQPDIVYEQEDVDQWLYETLGETVIQTNQSIQEEKTCSNRKCYSHHDRWQQLILLSEIYLQFQKTIICLEKHNIDILHIANCHPPWHFYTAIDCFIERH